MGSHSQRAPAGACTVLAVVAVAVLVVIVLFARGPRREKFTPQQAQAAQAAHSTAQELFATHGGGLTYSEYKTNAAERGQSVDPVLFTDLRKLWKDGRLTPGEVLRVM